MTDDPRYRSSRYDSLREERETERKEESALAVLVNETVRKLVTAIVIAGGLIGLGAYMSSNDVEAPRYQISTTPDGRIIRVNTDSGTVIVCEGNRCGIVVQRGQDLDDAPPPRAALPKEEARPALPAPAPTPDNQAAPTPAQR
jgi:hypothetical protein